MKKLIRFSIAVLALATCSTQVKAAFPIKQETKQAVVTEQTATPATATVTPEEAAAMLGTATTTTEVKKQGFFKRLFHAEHKGSAAMPQGVYILLAIFFLGWLAIGINDGWEGYDWLIALLLYFLFWLPGFIYSLVVMGRFY